MRVSEVLSYFQEPYLVAWKLRTKDWKKVGQAAMDVGSEVDQYVQDSINGEHPPVKPTNEKVSNCVAAWHKFSADHPEFITKARKFKSNMQRELTLGTLTGHPDFIFDDELPDLKTSKQISKSHWMQVAQYAWMYANSLSMTERTKEHLGFGVIKRISILRLDKFDPEGKYEYQVLEEPMITFWQQAFQRRYDSFKEEEVAHGMMRKVRERERLA